MAARVWWCVLAGFAGGFLSGFAGVGGGVILITAMVGVLGMAQHRAHGTSLAIIVPTALVAATQYFVAPHGGQPPPVELAVAYAATAIVGAPLGARLIVFVDPHPLRRLFGLLLLSLAAGSLTRKTALEPWGELLLAAGLVALLAGAVALAVRHRRGEPATVEAAPDIVP